MRKSTLLSLETVCVALGFLAVIHLFFPSDRLLTRHSSLENIWGTAGVFIGAKIILMKAVEVGVKIPWFVHFIFCKFAAGVWLGLTAGTLLILNQWYEDPDMGKWEPLFTATGLGAIGVATAERRAAKFIEKEKGKTAVEDESASSDPAEP